MATREIDPAALDASATYALLTSLVVPRPIAWVATVAADGTRNLAPHSYFNIISTDPPVVHFTSSGAKDTLRNAQASGEFVVNVVTEDLLAAMNLTAANFPPDEDEFAWAELETAPSAVVAAPRVARAQAALECRVRQTLVIGNGTMVFGDVVHVATAEQVWADGAISPERLAPIGRLAGRAYARMSDVVRLERPRWDGTRPV